MATVEHCLFCFEALAANLEDRTALSLGEVQASYAEYAKALDAESRPAPVEDASLVHKLKQTPAMQRLAETPSATSSSPSTPSNESSTSLNPGAETDASTPLSSINSSSSSLPPSHLPRRPASTGPPITASPLFVTWNKRSARARDYSLRGCIGNFSDLPLTSALAEYALISAFQDDRFPPIGAAELPLLSLGVVLLTDFEDARDAMDWELGRHGLRISFHWRNRRYGSTYLPDVAVEQGWSKEETLVSLMRKAGWSGREDQWRDVDLKVVRYQGVKESMEYEEFKAWRDWVDSGKQ